MRFITAFTCLLLGSTALAHFQIGTYIGTSEAGPCEITFMSKEFKNDHKHPLNEVVMTSYQYGNEIGQLRLTHLPVVDAVNGTVRPKSHTLSFVRPDYTGAWAFEVVMNHDGPQQYMLFTDVYRNPEKNSRFTCTDLKFQEEK